MFWLPIIAGATIGALTNKDPIKGAIIGGTLGAAGGATLGAGAGTAGGAGAAGGGLLGSTAGATGLVGAQNVAAPIISSGTAGIGASNIGASVIPGSIESTGMVFNPATGTYLDPSSFAFSGSSTPIYKGGEGLLSNAAGEVGSMVGELTPENLQGVSSLLGGEQDTSQYRQMAGTDGGVKQGSGQGLAVQMPQAKVFKRRKA